MVAIKILFTCNVFINHITIIYVLTEFFLKNYFRSAGLYRSAAFLNVSAIVPLRL